MEAKADRPSVPVERGTEHRGLHADEIEGIARSGIGGFKTPQLLAISFAKKADEYLDAPWLEHWRDVVVGPRWTIAPWQATSLPQEPLECVEGIIGRGKKPKVYTVSFCPSVTSSAAIVGLAPKPSK